MSLPKLQNIQELLADSYVNRQRVCSIGRTSTAAESDCGVRQISDEALWDEQPHEAGDLIVIGPIPPMLRVSEIQPVDDYGVLRILKIIEGGSPPWTKPRLPSMVGRWPHR